MKKTAKNKTIITALVIIALVALSGAAYVKVGQKPAEQTATNAETSASTPSPGPAGPAHDTPTSASPAASTPQPNPSHPASTTLAKPIGPNNNTSSVSLSGATSMESVCRSVPGASCYIQASKSGATIRVSDAKIVGSSAGSDGVIFSWDAKQLSAGQWQIQAIATKDGQTAASDSQLLRVQP
ncbi:MAG TPA: hypothetical protein VF272_04125 [Candidatus Saccharimonadia bacterium]